jgi:cell division inhibitor SepF
VSFLSKLKDIVGLDCQDNYDRNHEDVEQPPHGYGGYTAYIAESLTEFASYPTFTTGAVMQSNINITNTPGAVTSSVVMIEPRAFEEMPQVIDALRQQKSVILNMGLVRQEEAQRAIDFVAGGTYALDGHYERIGDNIFLFTPSCVQVTTPNDVFNEIVQAPVRPLATPKNSWANEMIAQ